MMMESKNNIRECRGNEADIAIEIRDVTKTYGKHRGISHLSFVVPKGDIFGFLGPNGAGKSTTIRCMLGMLHFQKGEIRILGMDAKKQTREILRKVGYMPSEAMFYPSMKVKDVIRLAVEARKMNCDSEARRICDLLDVDREKRISELSLGNRKKVSIVCAMQHQPELLILDEPTSGLDPLMQEVFFKLVLEQNARGTTCFLSSHVLSEVKRYCKNVAIIKEGELVKLDSVENLLRSGIRQVKVWQGGQERQFTYSGNARELIRELDTMQVDDVLIEEPSLEELFIHYYQEEA
ncbi:ATP-binding cassette domain-containing protein [Bariatricus sp. SGI.154]|uniref:ABC transporter ATP-binding protein n=1 Tax=Bariatricus sp. SGI.154 TaxID=3420549 RepID=UPI003D00A2DE